MEWGKWKLRPCPYCGRNLGGGCGDVIFHRSRPAHGYLLALSFLQPEFCWDKIAKTTAEWNPECWAWQGCLTKLQGMWGLELSQHLWGDDGKMVVQLCHNLQDQRRAIEWKPLPWFAWWR